MSVKVIQLLIYLDILHLSKQVKHIKISRLAKSSFSKDLKSDLLSALEGLKMEDDLSAGGSDDDDFKFLDMVPSSTTKTNSNDNSQHSQLKETSVDSDDDYYGFMDMVVSKRPKINSSGQGQPDEFEQTDTDSDDDYYGFMDMVVTRKRNDDLSDYSINSVEQIDPAGCTTQQTSTECSKG